MYSKEFKPYLAQLFAAICISIGGCSSTKINCIRAENSTAQIIRNVNVEIDGNNYKFGSIGPQKTADILFDKSLYVTKDTKVAFVQLDSRKELNLVYKNENTGKKKIIHVNILEDDVHCEVTDED